MPVIHQLMPGMAEQLKSVRLAGLQDSPSAFGSTYAFESELTDADWLTRSSAWSTGSSIFFVATHDDIPCGMISGKLDTDLLHRAHIHSMWVAPAQRRSGLATNLLSHVEQWAVSHNAVELRLMVTNTNTPAIHLYKKYDFTLTGLAEQYPNDPALLEYEMIKPI